MRKSVFSSWGMLMAALTVALTFGAMFAGCGDSEEDIPVYSEYNLYAMITTNIPKPSASVSTNYDLDAYNNLLGSIEGNGWEVSEEGIKRLTPVEGLSFIVDDVYLVTDAEGIASGTLNSDNVNHAVLKYADAIVPESSYDILIKDGNIFVNLKFDVSDVACEDGKVPLFSRGGDWDESKGRACLDDNGVGPLYFLGSDCDLALIKADCLIDYLWPDHNCYHHHNGKTCSAIIGHAQTRHEHGIGSAVAITTERITTVVNAVVNVVLKKIWPW